MKQPKLPTSSALTKIEIRDPIAAVEESVLSRGDVRPSMVRERPQARGKFLFLGNQKLYIRGVTYGTFEPDREGTDYPEPSVVGRDFAAMAASGVNAIRTYTVPPRWLLDLAASWGLFVMVGIPWEEHVTFLDDRATKRSIEERVRAAVRECESHPAILAYAVGNEIPGPIVRWHGRRRIERFLERLCAAVRSEDPDGLVTYVNYPSTEYLDLPFVDFVSFNVYLESDDKFSSYLPRLQNIAKDKPLVLAELGLDSSRNGLTKQAELLSRQVSQIFHAGGAGVFVFAWTDEWYRGGHHVTDWDFGLTTRDRRPKKALQAVSAAFAEAPLQPYLDWPRISVVVCSYNGSRTIADCCKGLQELEHPDFEVIFIDDGSTDTTGEIAASYGYRVVHTENRGLSAARNLGMALATGDIIAYLDDDARPDPHWLQYLAVSFLSSDHVAIGGPNIAPPGDGTLADCVANAPGGPVHVLLTDATAEHIPGCNFAVRRDNLLAIGGFDARFRVAGDDVDACWRLQHQGWTIGYCPGALVWHHRRNSLKAYWRQQVGYGRAEALLENKWPERYNTSGHVSWQGRIYGQGALTKLPWVRSRVYGGVWGSAAFQSIYEPSTSSIAALPLMPEWNLVIAMLAVISILGVLWSPLLVAIPLLLVAISASDRARIHERSARLFHDATIREVDTDATRDAHHRASRGAANRAAVGPSAARSHPMAHLRKGRASDSGGGAAPATPFALEGNLGIFRESSWRTSGSSQELRSACPSRSRLRSLGSPDLWRTFGFRSASNGCGRARIRETARADSRMARPVIPRPCGVADPPRLEPHQRRLGSLDGGGLPSRHLQPVRLSHYSGPRRKHRLHHYCCRSESGS
jgi:O-antigen biosynthesis protein